MQPCLKRVSGWHGAGCYWGIRMMSDDMKVSKGLGFPVVALPGVGRMRSKGLVPYGDFRNPNRLKYPVVISVTYIGPCFRRKLCP